VCQDKSYSSYSDIHRVQKISSHQYHVDNFVQQCIFFNRYEQQQRMLALATYSVRHVHMTRPTYITRNTYWKDLYEAHLHI